MNTTNKEHFRTIRRAIENNKLAVFVGSAVSYDSGLPSWRELISSMKDSLESPRTDDYLKIAEHYYLEYGKNTYFNKINDFFPSESEPNDLHKLILDLKPQHIITTNWDDLLEKSIRNEGELYFTVANDHQLAASPSSQLLIKMHGDLSHRNIVFKESDYLSYSDKFPLIENFIKSIFSTHIVIFIGYSISDYNLNQILSWIRNRTPDAPPSFTILTESKITLSESNYLREKAVYPILSDDGNTDHLKQKYRSLSDKSLKVAKILKNIVQPENIELQDVISEIATDISCWEIVYPTILVMLFQDRLNITKVNQIYYESSFNVINYHLTDEEQNYDRNKYRKIRKSLVQILQYLPVCEIRLYVSIEHDKFLRIKNHNEFKFIDEYVNFNFNYIHNRVALYQDCINNDLDKKYQFAFDNYYLKLLTISRKVYMHIANLYFSKSLFVKSLICSFNKKQLCFGEIPVEEFKDSDFYQIAMEEQLSRNDNISDMIEKFPKSIVSRQKPLFQELDSNNLFLLERFRTISNLSSEIDAEIESINNGSLVFSNRIASMYNQVYCTIMFINKNKIAVLYHSDYKNIAKLGFESILKRLSIDKDVKLDDLLAYTGIISFKEKELIKFLSDCLIDDQSLVIVEETVEYIFDVLDNSLKTISSSNHSITLRQYCIKIWSNALILLSYAKHDEGKTKEIVKRLIDALNCNRWFDLSGNVNRFIIFQVNRYENSFSVEDLKNMFDTQLEKINLTESIPFQDNGSLFSNLLYLMKEKNIAELDIFKDNKQLKIFFSKIENMELIERLRAINGFVFAIYYLASGELKTKVENILENTFHDAKKVDFYEYLISFGLNLYNLDLLDDTELEFVLSQLKTKVNDHIQNGSSEWHYPVIKNQLSKINKDKLSDFKEVIENVGKLSNAFENFSLRNFFSKSSKKDT